MIKARLYSQGTQSPVKVVKLINAKYKQCHKAHGPLSRGTDALRVWEGLPRPSPCGDIMGLVTSPQCRCVNL